MTSSKNAFMPKIFYLLILVIITGCSFNIDKHLTSNFTDNEIQQMDALVALFEKRTMADCKLSKQECYNNFFLLRKSPKGNEFTRNDINLDNEEIKAKMGSSFEAFFRENSKVYNHKSDDPTKERYTTQGLLPNYNGKYLELVDYINKNTTNVFLKEYCSRTLEMKVFSITNSIELMLRYSELDFKNKSTRFLIIVHLHSLDIVKEN